MKKLSYRYPPELLHLFLTEGPARGYRKKGICGVIAKKLDESKDLIEMGIWELDGSGMIDGLSLDKLRHVYQDYRSKKERTDGKYSSYLSPDIVPYVNWLEKMGYIEYRDVDAIENKLNNGVRPVQSAHLAHFPKQVFPNRTRYQIRK